ncbi:5-methylcytosine-specific restriction protein A [Bradyrhizobium japonicum]|uniref:HNH endonuclease n=1 Tax=Bradyrhizobium diazoefficiens TaxID=1355477 RepID=UPI003488C507
MQEAKVNLLREVLEQGTGAGVIVEPHSTGVRAGLRSYFAGLTSNQGPYFTLAPTGLKRHQLTMQFGKFALPCVAQMQTAGKERLAVAHALLQQAGSRGTVTLVPNQNLADWVVTGADFRIDVMVMDVPNPTSDDAITGTATRVMVPLMAAMAELIGYDEEPFGVDEFDEEGRVTISTVKRRERSPRNRLLALSIHGDRCAACGLKTAGRYGPAGAIIEVHHLEPVSMLSQPRAYDPRTDLVPLCPNCHRAVHTRRPIPYTLEELRGMLTHGD